MGVVADAIDKRASVRAYTDEAVTDEDVRSLLAAAMAAPSAGNQQPWEFVVVRDEGLRARLAAASPYAKPALKAPVVLVFCMREEGARFPEMVVQDLAAAVENCLLRAVSLGLGAVWLGIYPEEDRVAVVAEALGLADGVVPFALVACGHPEREVRPSGLSRFDEARIDWR